MPIIRYVAWLLGLLMNGIFFVISQMGIPNVGLAIILFTIILLTAMMPLQVSQQRFSKLNYMMQPEIQRIQNKYKGKRDQVSQQKQMDEINAVYAKYGVSQAGSCIQMLIQLPVLFALYQVIYKIPGYITMIGDRIRVIATNSDFLTVFSKFVTDQNNSTLTRNFAEGATTNNVIDAIYGLSTKQWEALTELCKGQSFESTLENVHSYVHRATYFLGLNISDSPWQIMRTAVTERSGLWGLMLFAAILIPVVAWGTQRLNSKLMPQPKKAEGNDTAAQMQNSMQSMNTVMPIISAVFCLTLPTGVGIYWVMSAGTRCVQQVIINRKLDKETEEDIIRKAQEKANKKREKKGLPPQKISDAAHVSTRRLADADQERRESASVKAARNQKSAAEATEYYNARHARPGSIAAKANMVRDFDEKNGGTEEGKDSRPRYKK